jgi:hypothetical protein
MFTFGNYLYLETFIFKECLYLEDIYIWRIFIFDKYSYLEDVHIWKHLYLEDVNYKTSQNPLAIDIPI